MVHIYDKKKFLVYQAHNNIDTNNTRKQDESKYLKLLKYQIKCIVIYELQNISDIYYLVERGNAKMFSCYKH